jgi:hypothetical protein
MFDKIFQLLKKKELQLFEAPEPEAPEPEAKFGGETMYLGETNEELPGLSGIRVKRIDSGEEGAISDVFINRKTQIVQIWVYMDGRYISCFRPQHIEFIDAIPLQYQTKLLSRGDE